MRLLIATSNPGKAREFAQMLGDGEVQASTLADHTPLLAVEETGQTFRANACLKATHFATALNTWTLADDSGLEVDALDGKPGVLSARWAQTNGTGRGDADNNATLLRQLQAVPTPRRTARFVCALALCDPAGRVILTAQDSVEGTIVDQPRGTLGFGYDPLFYVSELGRTTAELEPADKHRISHRGKALRRMRALMDRAGLFSPAACGGSETSP